MKRKANSAPEHSAPSRRDIASACREIQSGWSDNERRKRAGLPKYEAWNPPTIRSSQLGGDAEVDAEF
jgi:hypothetical protein